MTTLKNKTKSYRAHWYVWLVPVLALGISAFLFIQHHYDHGPKITIFFEDASVIQADKTHIRYRGADIGVVKSLALTEDRKGVNISATLNKGLDDFAVEGSKFWVVTPIVSLEGLTGLDTIFSGPYVEAVPGPADAAKQTEFKAKSEDDNTQTVESTVSYIIETNNAESISVGDSITFRGIKVGSTNKVTLNKDSQIVEVQINIQNKYARLIRTNTVFWRKVGIQADLGLFGSKIKVNSLDSIMHGGMEFATPDAAGEIAKHHTKFGLAGAAPKDYGKWNPKLE
jgi:paraquat-inducible protein B